MDVQTFLNKVAYKTGMDILGDGDVPNEKLRGTIGGCLHHIKPLGKGEWVVATIEDAKQMAVDFNEGVS